MARERGLYRRKDSPYWWIDVVLPDGRRVCESTRLREHGEAEEYLVGLKAEAYEFRRQGITAPRGWQEAVVRYLAECQGKRSMADDRDHLRKLDPYLRDKRLDRITMDAVWPFMRDRQGRDGVANATINRALEIVRRILNLAHQDWNWLQRVPRIRMLPEPKRRIRFLKREEADRLLEALPEHLRPVVRFALATGCRMSEILRLEWRRVDFGRGVAWLDPGTTKNGEGRGVPLNADAVLALRGVEGIHERWCFTYEGQPMQAVGSAWERSLRRAGIEDFRFHDLRHTWASWHVMSGTRLQELMELGGWKSFEMVLRYAHLAPEHLASVARRIETGGKIVDENSTIALRQSDSDLGVGISR
jgi:integrase